MAAATNLVEMASPLEATAAEAEALMRHNFALLKPACLKVMVLLQGLNAAARAAVITVEPLVELRALLCDVTSPARLQPQGMPRCIDYVLLPLLLLLPDVGPAVPAVVVPDRIREAALGCIVALFDACGGALVFCSHGSGEDAGTRVSDTLQRCVSVLSIASAAHHGSSASEETLCAALQVLTSICSVAVAGAEGHGNFSTVERARSPPFAATAPPPFNSPAAAGHTLSLLLQILSAAAKDERVSSRDRRFGRHTQLAAAHAMTALILAIGVPPDGTPIISAAPGPHHVLLFLPGLVSGLTAVATSRFSPAAVAAAATDTLRALLTTGTSSIAMDTCISSKDSVSSWLQSLPAQVRVDVSSTAWWQQASTRVTAVVQPLLLQAMRDAPAEGSSANTTAVTSLCVNLIRRCRHVLPSLCVAAYHVLLLHWTAEQWREASLVLPPRLAKVLLAQIPLMFPVHVQHAVDFSRLRTASWLDEQFPDDCGGVIPTPAVVVPLQDIPVQAALRIMARALEEAAASTSADLRAAIVARVTAVWHSSGYLATDGAAIADITMVTALAETLTLLCAPIPVHLLHMLDESLGQAHGFGVGALVEGSLPPFAIAADAAALTALTADNVDAAAHGRSISSSGDASAGSVSALSSLLDVRSGVSAAQLRPQRLEGGVIIALQQLCCQLTRLLGPAITSKLMSELLSYVSCPGKTAAGVSAAVLRGADSAGTAATRALSTHLSPGPAALQSQWLLGQLIQASRAELDTAVNDMQHLSQQQEGCSKTALREAALRAKAWGSSLGAACKATVAVLAMTADAAMEAASLQSLSSAIAPLCLPVAASPLHDAWVAADAVCSEFGTCLPLPSSSTEAQQVKHFLTWAAACMRASCGLLTHILLACGSRSDLFVPVMLPQLLWLSAAEDRVQGTRAQAIAQASSSAAEAHQYVEASSDSLRSLSAAATACLTALASVTVTHGGTGVAAAAAVHSKREACERLLGLPLPTPPSNTGASANSSTVAAVTAVAPVADLSLSVAFSRQPTADATWIIGLPPPVRHLLSVHAPTLTDTLLHQLRSIVDGSASAFASHSHVPALVAALVSLPQHTGLGGVVGSPSVHMAILDDTSKAVEHVILSLSAGTRSGDASRIAGQRSEALLSMLASLHTIVLGSATCAASLAEPIPVLQRDPSSLGEVFLVKGQLRPHGRRKALSSSLQQTTARWAALTAMQQHGDTDDMFQPAGEIVTDNDSSKSTHQRPPTKSALEKSLSRLPFLTKGARNVLARCVTAAVRFLSSAAAAGMPPLPEVDSSGVSQLPLPVLQQLRLTRSAMDVLATGSLVLARHPDTLYPLLHTAWPSVVALLPPVSLPTAMLRMPVPINHPLMSALLPAGSVLPAVSSSPSSNSTTQPRAAASLSGSRQSSYALDALTAATTAFVLRRAAALAETQRKRDESSDSSSGRAVAPVQRVLQHPTQLPLLSAAEDAERLAAADTRQSKQLVWQADDSSHSNTTLASTTNNLASQLQVQWAVFAASLRLCALLAVPPQSSVPSDGNTADTSSWTLGAAAGDFLRSRFASDVYLRLRACLMAAALEARAVSTGATYDGSGASRVLLPRQRMLLDALRAVIVLCRPVVSITREASEDEKAEAAKFAAARASATAEAGVDEGDGHEAGSSQPIFGQGTHASTPYGSDTRASDMRNWRQRANHAASSTVPSDEVTEFTADASLLRPHAAEVAQLLAACVTAAAGCPAVYTQALQRLAGAAQAAVADLVDAHAVAAARGRMEQR